MHQTMQEWIKEPNKYPNCPKSQTLQNPSHNTTNSTVSHVCRVGVRQLFLTLTFFLLIQVEFVVVMFTDLLQYPKLYLRNK